MFSKKFSLSFFFLALVAIGGFLAVRYIRSQSLTSKIDEYINAYVRRGQFSGAVLVAKDGKIILSKGYGMANYELDVPNTPETKFRIGSITKQFTAMAIVQLQEKGLLNVKDPISKHIPDYPRGDEITILHLLNHRSGIKREMGLSIEETKLPISLEKLVELFKNEPLSFNPGEKFQYSNCGYILLAYVIEKVSGKTYEEFLKENIFKPLGMINSGHDHHEIILKNRASGYRGPHNADYVDLSMNKGAGGLYSTVKDLYLWNRALYTDMVASKESINKIIKSMKKDPIKDEYSFGWVFDDFFGKTGMWHSGWTTGFRSFFIRFINNDLCIIILSNIEFLNIEQMGINIAAIVFGEKYKIPKKRVAIKVNPKIYNEYIGQYELKPDFILSITKEGDLLKATGQVKITFFPESETKFFCKDADIQISFIKDKDGNVTKLILHQGGMDQKAKKIK